MTTPHRLARQRRACGLTLLEMVIVLALMAGTFVAILDVLHLLGSGMQEERAHSDVTTRTQGTMYDIVAELRQATAYSPNFFIEQDITKPPRMTFDLVDGVDSNGNIVWGNKVTYRLVKAPASENKEFSYTGIVPGQLLRDESGTKTPLFTTLIEDVMPYQFVENGVSKWGFMVSRDGNALSLSLSRMAIVDPKKGIASSATVVSTTSGVYFLRNPQVVITLQ